MRWGGVGGGCTISRHMGSKRVCTAAICMASIRHFSLELGMFMNVTVGYAVWDFSGMA